MRYDHARNMATFLTSPAT